MRLIDAERFECIGFQATGEQRYDDGFADGAMFISERIDSAPTIDAIPVEWLERVQRECVADIQQVPMYVAIGWLIDMWQNEQEAQDG